MGKAKLSFLGPLAAIIFFNTVQCVALEGPSAQVADLTAACFASTCGTEYVFSHPFKNSVQPYLESTALVDKELKRAIELFMGRMIHQSVVTNKIYQNLSKLKVAPLNETEKGFILSMLYLQKMDKYSSAITVDGKGQGRFDRTKLKALPEKLSEVEINAICSLKDLISFNLQQLPIINQLSYVQIIKLLYPKTAFLQASQLDAKAALAVYDRLGILVPGLKTFTNYDVVLGRAAAGSILSLSEMTYLKKQILSRLVIELLLQPQIQAEFQKIPWDFQLLMQDQFNTYQKSPLAKAVQDPKSIKKILKDAVKDCSGYLAYSYAALPTQKQIADFKVILTQIELTAQQMMEEKTKTSLSGKFDFEVNMPPAKDQVIPQWRAFLQQATIETEKRIKVLNEMNLAEPNIQAAAYIMMGTDSTQEIFGSVSSFCHQAAPGFLDDAMLLVDNSIHLSWPTIVHPEVGAAVIAHEVGHVIQKDWPQTILKENACLVGKQGSTTYLKEDFADLFSAEIMRRRGAQLAGLAVNNLGCGLVPPTGDRGQLLLKNTEKGDPHSSGFYRTLSTAAVQQKLTRECSTLLTTIKETRFDKYCQWEK